MSHNYLMRDKTMNKYDESLYNEKIVYVLFDMIQYDTYKICIDKNCNDANRDMMYTDENLYVEYITNIVKNNKTISEIRIMNGLSRIPSHALKSLYTAIANHPNIIEIHIDYEVDNIIAQFVANIIITSKSLISVILDGHFRQQLNTISYAFKQNRNLQKIDLSDGYYENEINMIIPSLSTSYNLTYLNLYNNYIVNFTEIINMLKSLDHISHLDLSYNYIGEQFDKMVSVLKNKKMLKYFNIAANDIQNISKFAKMLRKNTSLIEINISNNMLEYDDIINLCDALRANRHIKILDISDNEIVYDDFPDIMWNFINKTDTLLVLKYIGRYDKSNCRGNITVQKIKDKIDKNRELYVQNRNYHLKLSNMVSNFYRFDGYNNILSHKYILKTIAKYIFLNSSYVEELSTIMRGFSDMIITTDIN